MYASIVIPTYNHLDDCLKPCLTSILKMTTIPDVEIIVVANGCTDGTRQYLTQDLKGVKNLKVVWSDEPLGYTKATNLGIKQAKGEYVVLLNNDTVFLDKMGDGPNAIPVPPNTWLDMLTEPLKRDPKVGLTGPMQAWSPEANQNFIIFFCVCIRRTLFDEIGILDESFSPGFGEDTEFSIRAVEHGYRFVQVPDMQHHYNEPGRMVGHFPIWHEGEATFREHPEGWELLTKNRLALVKRFAKEIKLNLGSGDMKLPGYLNCDLYNKNADLKIDATDLSAFDDDTVSEIKAIHLFEHLPVTRAITVLKEWFRVLKPGGKVVIETPDILELCRNFEAADKEGRYRLLNCVYGLTFPETPHLFCWYDEILADHLHGAGFENMQRTEIEFKNHWGYNMRVEATKPGAVELPEGYFSLADIDAYRNLVSQVPDNGIIAELGVWKGKSLCSVADLIKKKNLKVLAVDHFQGTANFYETELSDIAKHEDIKATFQNSLKRFGIETHVVIYDSPTTTAALAVPERMLDLCFIDADHSYEACKTDIEHWLPKVKTGGIIAGHDFVEAHSGVMQAV